MKSQEVKKCIEAYNLNLRGEQLVICSTESKKLAKLEAALRGGTSAAEAASEAADERDDTFSANNVHQSSTNDKDAPLSQVLAAGSDRWKFSATSSGTATSIWVSGISPFTVPEGSRVRIERSNGSGNEGAATITPKFHASFFEFQTVPCATG